MSEIKNFDALSTSSGTFHDLRGTAITFAYGNLDKSHDEKIKLIADISGILLMMPRRHKEARPG